MIDQNHKIAILGCTIGNMIMALSLAHKKKYSLILEKQKFTLKNSSSDLRNIALTATSVQILQKINIWQYLSTEVSFIQNIYVADGHSNEILEFSNKLNNFENMGYLINYSTLKSILQQLIFNNHYIEIIDEYEITALESNLHNTIIYGSKTFSCNILIISNENNFKYFDQYFLTKLIKNYNQTALIFEVQHSKSHEYSAIEHFTKLGAFAILPLKSMNKSSIVWIVDFDLVDTLVNLHKDEFQYLVQQNFGNSFGKVDVISQIQQFRLKAKLTKNYFHNRIILIGDAAHTIHPLAGQGLNLGIKDIAALTNFIQNDRISNENLSYYEKQRQSDNEAMFLATNSLNFLFSYYFEPLYYLRKKGLASLNSWSGLKKQIINYAKGIR